MFHRLKSAEPKVKFGFPLKEVNTDLLLEMERKRSIVFGSAN